MKKLFGVAVVAAAVAAPMPAVAQLAVNPSTIGQSIFVNSTDDVIATFILTDAAFTNRLFLVGRDGEIFNNQASAIGSTVNLGSFAVGTELVFRLNVDGSLLNFPVYDYFTGPGTRNPDGIAHAAASTPAGVTFIGFEDIFGGGDRDYNDLVFSFSNTSAVAVPEPATWAMMIGGFGLVGGAMRRRQRANVTYA